MNVSELLINDTLILADDETRVVQLVLSRNSTSNSTSNDAITTFRVLSQPESAQTEDGSWQLHASGTLKLEPVRARASDASLTLAVAQTTCTTSRSIADFYNDITMLGMGYGPDFQAMTQLWVGKDAALARVQLPATVAGEQARYHFHPAMLDACLQAIGALLPADKQQLYVPLQIEGFRCYSSPGAQVWSHAQLQHIASNHETLTLALHIYNTDGTVLAEADKIVMKRVSVAALEQVARQTAKADELLYEVTWQPQAISATASSTFSPTSPGRWLIFTDSRGIGPALARRLTQRGDSCTLVEPGTAYRQISASQWQIAPDNADHMRQLMADIAKSALPLRGVVQLWGIGGMDVPKDASPIDAQSLSLASTLHIAQMLGPGPGNPCVAGDTGCASRDRRRAGECDPCSAVGAGPRHRPRVSQSAL